MVMPLTGQPVLTEQPPWPFLCYVLVIAVMNKTLSAFRDLTLAEEYRM